MRFLGRDLHIGAVACLAAVIFLSSYTEPSGGGISEAETGISCFVSILPQAFFLERIGSRHVDVHVMIGPGQAPHAFEPTARMLSELSRSQLYLAIGVAFEELLLERISRNFERVRIVDTSAGIERRMMVHDHAVTSAGDTGSGGVPRESVGRTTSLETRDPHVWLSPRLAVIVAGNMRDALIEVDPQHAAEYRENCRRLDSDLEELDREISRVLAPYRGRKIFVFHPAYGYFADAYGLVQVAIEEGGRAPGPRHLAEVIERAKGDGARVIFVQPQVSTTQAKTVAGAVGAEVVELDPLARDYIENLRRMAREIAESFGAEG